MLRNLKALLAGMGAGIIFVGMLRIGFAATSYVGQIIQDINVSRVGGTAVSANAGNADGGTQRVVIATNQAVLPVSDNSGILTVDAPVGTPVAVRQSDGTNFYQVAASSQLPAALVSGRLDVNVGNTAAVNTSQVGGNAVATGNGVATTGTQRVAIASDNTAFSVNVTLAAGTNDAGQFGYVRLSTAAVTNVGCTTTSGQLLASNTSRRGVECHSRCTNTDRTFINVGAPAATSTTWPLEACSSWQPPPGLVLTSAIQCLSNSGTQTLVCLEY